MSAVQRVVIGITGATGAVIGVRLLERLAEREDVETHLIMSAWGRRTLEYETGLDARKVEGLADHYHKPNDMWSPLASGSFVTSAMIVAPCSMRTLAAIATGVSDGLLARVADVTLKERRRLVVVPRETPLSELHLRNMARLARMGASLVPPMMTFYNRPETIEDMLAHLVQRVLDQVGIVGSDAPRWDGPCSVGDAREETARD